MTWKVYFPWSPQVFNLFLLLLVSFRKILCGLVPSGQITPPTISLWSWHQAGSHCPSFKHTISWKSAFKVNQFAIRLVCLDISTSTSVAFNAKATSYANIKHLQHFNRGCIKFDLWICLAQLSIQVFKFHNRRSGGHFDSSIFWISHATERVCFCSSWSCGGLLGFNY